MARIRLAQMMPSFVFSSFRAFVITHLGSLREPDKTPTNPRQASGVISRTLPLTRTLTLRLLSGALSATT